MKIDVYCNDGSPLGITPDYIYTRGVGGAELALMSWAEVMAQRGHQVRVFNDPREPGNYSGVDYLPQGLFNSVDKRDVFIAWRSPNPFMRTAKAEVKIHWSCDQYTIGNFRTDIVPLVDHVVCISPYHRDYYLEHYGGAEKVGYFDLGVRLQDYDQDVAKVPGKCIYCSVPDRGLEILYSAWPKIKAEVPEASLVITGDYRLWGAPEAGNQRHKMAWRNQESVTFLGAIPRMEMVKHQLEAVCQPYPCIYEELFCISAAECQVAGSLPVTTTIGALETTVRAGMRLGGDPREASWQALFVDETARMLSESPEIQIDRLDAQQQGRQRFDWQRICGQWETLIEMGQFFEEDYVEMVRA